MNTRLGLGNRVAGMSYAPLASASLVISCFSFSNVTCQLRYAVKSGSHCDRYACMLTTCTQITARAVNL